jgi:hypothetical protein
VNTYEGYSTNQIRRQHDEVREVASIQLSETLEGRQRVVNFVVFVIKNLEQERKLSNCAVQKRVI